MSHASDDLRYDRPNQPWLCGLKNEACPCPTGPTQRGRCPTLGECRPVRDGDRWVCNRSDLRGGPCDPSDSGSRGGGPTDDGQCCRVHRCRPRRSWRSVRGRWLTGVAAMTVGSTLMLLGAGARNEWIVPGPLTSHHAQVLREAGSNRCDACHPGARENTAGLLSDAWRGDSNEGASIEHGGLSQSALCLECHRDLSEQGAEPLLAHGLPTERLDRQERSTRSFVSASLGGGALGRSHDDPLACAACHQEHHGAKHDLSAMTDARCQACHAERYRSFADDHPGFALWPTERRTRIAFNHASHSTRHFDKANQPFDCRVCHQQDSSGDLTSRPSYQIACASCHDEEIEKSFVDGLALISLPTLDTDTLPAEAPAVADWPNSARGDFDGVIPPLMKLLLAADPSATEAMVTLGEDFTFFDIDPDLPEHLAAAATLSKAIRGLIDELQEEGHGALEYRLRRALDRSETPDPLANYAGRLPVDLIDRVQAEWFGDGEPPEPFDAIEDRRTGGGWSLEERDFSLRYRPTGHDDPLVRAWLDAIVALPPKHAALRDACLAEFTRPGAPGACFECHTLERTADDRLLINWRGRERLLEPRGFTRFSHRPHLAQPELADCTACHAIDPSVDLTTYFAGVDPHKFRSEFVAISKADCASCHRPHAAGDSCTQCHNYHVEPLAILPKPRTASDD